MSRHAACYVPVVRDLKRTRIPVSIPVRITPGPSNDTILVEVKKMKTSVSELQENMAVEMAARNELRECVEKILADNAIKRYPAQDAVQRNQTIHQFLKRLPCTSLEDLDMFLVFVGDESNFLQWVC